MDLSATIHYLGNLLGQVISEQESPELFDLEEQIRLNAKARRSGDDQAADRLNELIAGLTPAEARVIASAFTVYFDLVNLAEEIQRVQILRKQELENYPQPVKESIQEALATLKQRGVTAEQLAPLLENLCIEPVLTAHPTEAKRRTLLSKIQRISELLQILNRPDLLPREEQSCRSALHAEITAMWLTDRARSVRLTVTDEVRTNLFFVSEIFWELLPKLYHELNQALNTHYPGRQVKHTWLRLASWVGGDRDGNPNVTTEVTAETLRLHRGLAVEKHRTTLQEIARRLSVSKRRIPPPPELGQWIENRRPFPPHVAYLEHRYAFEPYRLTLSLLAHDLEQASKDDVTGRLLSDSPSPPQLNSAHFSIPLHTIQRALPESLNKGYLEKLQTQLDIFGLHAARLDIREDARRLRASLGEILRALNLMQDFETCPEDQRISLLVNLLEQPAPSLAAHPGVTPETAETWKLFQLITRIRQIYGDELIGPFIISMTTSPADILTVLLLAHWTGCKAGLMITPLFETLSDLKAAAQVLRDLFAMPVYRRHLQSCGNQQMVMIGYSDSNKDGGYLAANWALYQAQEETAAACRQAQVQLTIFHGRGGTTARGGGPTNRAILAQPPGSIYGRLRLTEQGETITARYLNPDLARRHLEQVVNAVLLASFPETRLDASIPRRWRDAMNDMALAAYRAYRSLVYETPGFMDYWKSATPLDEITRLTIGSRPSTRQGSSLAVSSIRAIPWVFSWMQSRFNIPGWFGLGSGLQACGDLALLQDMYQNWYFFSTLLDNAEMSLLKADMDIAAMYSRLAADQAMAHSIFGVIRAEYDRTKEAILQVSGHLELMDNEPVVQRSIHLRNPYVDPLNYLQVLLLNRLRKLKDPEGEEAAALREVLVITINGIAAGLRNTG